MPLKNFLLAITALLSLSVVISADCAELVYLNTPIGSQRLIHADINKQYFALESFVDTQENLAFCGPASMAAALNSLPVSRPKTKQLGSYAYFTQDSLFTAATQKIKSRGDVLQSGLTLTETAEFLVELGAASTVYYGNEFTADTFRTLVKQNLSNPNARILVDFDRASLHQEGSGHFSPIAAYDSDSDSILVLDVAKFKYPPFWVSTADLLTAIQTIDPDTGKSRGLIVLEKPLAP